MARTASGSRETSFGEFGFTADDGQALAAARASTLLQRQFHALFFARDEFVLRDDARAGVPAQERIVIPVRTDGLSFFEPIHGVTKPIVGVKPRAGSALSELHLGTAFRQDAGIISPLVFALQPRQKLLRLRIAHSIAFAKAVADREQESDQRLLIVRVRLQHVETDALRLPRFIEQAITLGFFQR